MIFRWFESLIDAFKEPVDGMPPTSVWRFYAFYLRQVWPVFAAALVVGFGVAIVEVSLFGFIGRIVDMAKGTPAADFFQAHGRDAAVDGAGGAGRCGRCSTACTTCW